LARARLFHLLILEVPASGEVAPLERWRMVMTGATDMDRAPESMLRDDPS
jgi:hypothetical protein